MTSINQDDLYEGFSLTDDIDPPIPPEAAPPADPETPPEDPTPPVDESEKADPPIPPEAAPPADPETPPEDPTPPVEQTPAPVTADDIRSIVRELRDEERYAGKQVDSIYDAVEKKFYPNGLSRVMVDSETGRQIRTAQDVIDLAGNPDLTIEEAERWRLQKQAEWDANVRDIESGVRKIAEQTVSLDKGTEAVLNRYAKVFEAYPGLENKALQNYMKTVTISNGVVVGAPVDIEDYFADIMEPYRLAYEAALQKPTPPVAPPSPKVDDRLDLSGDGGDGGDDADPDDFEAQLRKEFNND